MNRITKAALQSWRSDLESDSRIATATKNDLIGFVKQIFAFAYNTYDFYDSAKILKPFKKTLDDTHEMHIITPEDFNKMISYETDEIIKAILIFMFRTGCRKSEARALYKEDYNPVMKSVHIYINPCDGMNHHSRQQKQQVPCVIFRWMIKLSKQ